jgi:uncharacterized protein (DUF2062 family)
MNGFIQSGTAASVGVGLAASVGVASGVLVTVGSGVNVTVGIKVFVAVGSIIAGAGAQEANKITTRIINGDFVFIYTLILQGTAQRFALAAGGRAWIRFESRKNPKPEKCLKMRQNPTSRLHAVLARF